MLAQPRSGGDSALTGTVPSPASCAIVAVGDELLAGFTVDTNGAWVGRRAATLGLPVRARFVVGDNGPDIRGAVRRALEVADVVLVTGGLGPTADDITREVVAGMLGRPLRLDDALLAELRTRWASWRATPLPAGNARMARIPEGALVLPNRVGTAPGLVLDVDGRTVVLLPGVPAEMRALFSDGVVPLLRARLGDRLLLLAHRIFHTTGIAESSLAERIDAGLPENLGPVSIAFLPRLTGVDLRLTARATPDDPQAARWLDRVEALVEPVVRPYLYRADSGDIVESIAREMVSSERTLAVAESCTGGLVARRITELPGSSGYFLGGVVTYADEAKRTHLGVPRELLAGHGAVSEEVARAMARGVAGAFGADVGLAVTGVAGPGGGSAEKPVGTVWYAVHLDGRTEARRSTLPGERRAVRERSAQAVLALLHRLLRSG